MSSTPPDAEPKREAHADNAEPSDNIDVVMDASEMADTAESRAVVAETQHRELHDRFLRLAADFENWKKRAKREQDESARKGRESLLKELLPALDNLERALKAAPEKDPLAVGVALVDKQILSILEKFEVQRFSSLGQPFDPNMHEAIQQVESADVAPGSVATEFAHGYTIAGRLLRAAMVAVAKAPAAPTQGAGGEN